MDACYGSGAVAGAVIGTFLATLVLVTLGHFAWQRRKAKQNPLRDLVLVEGGDVKGGYDNIGFTEDHTNPTSIKVEPSKDAGKVQKATSAGKDRENMGGESRKSPWSHFGFLLGSRNTRHSFDASPTDVPLEYSVSLKGHDFTGLGFSVGGGLKEGILVKEVMQRGPAAESNQIQPGN